MEAKFLLIIIAITALVFGNQSVSAKEFIVGDEGGWRIPESPTTFSDWASQHIFSVGDTLVFNFVSGFHSVAIVDEAAFKTCDTSNMISVFTQTPALVPLKSTGQLHFICASQGHCLAGQSLAINVTTGSTSGHDHHPPIIVTHHHPPMINVTHHDHPTINITHHHHPAINVTHHHHHHHHHHHGLSAPAPAPVLAPAPAPAPAPSSSPRLTSLISTNASFSLAFLFLCVCF